MFAANNMKNIMDRIRIVLLLMMVMLILTFAKNDSYAATEKIEDKVLAQYMREYHVDTVMYIKSYEDLVEYSYKCFMERKGIVVIYTGTVPINSNNINKLIEDVIRIDNPETLYDCEGLWGNMDGYNKAVLDSKEGTMICISINYKRSQYDLERLEQEINKAINNFGSIGNMTREKKLKLIHDYICETFEYDESYINSDEYAGYFENENGVRTMVCQGYSLLFYKMANKMGIPCKIVISATHSWNIVQLEDGLWYQIDCTNDDLGIYGKETVYENFLKPELSGEIHEILEPCVLYENLNRYAFGTRKMSNTEIIYFMKRVLLKGDFKYLMDNVLRIHIFILITVSFVVLLALTVFIMIQLRKRIIATKKKRSEQFEKYNNL